MGYLDLFTQQNDGTRVATPQIVESYTFPQEIIEFSKFYPELPMDQVAQKYYEYQSKKQHLDQGKEKMPYDKQQSTIKQKQVEVQEKEIEKAENAQKALKEVDGMMKFISPSNYVELFSGKDLNAGQEFAVDILLDPSLYLSAGVLPFIKTLGKAGIKKAGKEVIEEGVEKLGSNLMRLGSSSQRVIPPQLNTSGNFNHLFDYQRQRLKNYYSSSMYLDRLKKAGFTEQEAKERIEALINNLNLPIKVNTQIPVMGMTNTIYSNNALNNIEINPKLMTTKDELFTTGMEELGHASELNGKDWNSIKQQIIDEYGSVENFNNTYPDEYAAITKETDQVLHKKLHNDKANKWNSQFLPEINKQEIYNALPPEAKQYLNTLSPVEQEMYLDMASEYYRQPSEIRTRALGAIMDYQNQYSYHNQPSATLSKPKYYTLGKEYFKYYNGKNLNSYLDNFISAPLVMFGAYGLLNNTNNNEK